MTKIKLQFDGAYRRYIDNNKEFTSYYTYRNNVLIPQEKINDLNYICAAILSEMYNRPDNKDFKDKIVLVEGIITFDILVNGWPKLYGTWITITDIKKDGDILTGNTEIQEG